MANEIESNDELNATQLDAQRARQLLNRALGLSERGDIAGAIVTCRQSLALAPNSSQGWSMLGLLHERDGDIDGAIEAYEKTLQLSAGSSFERESLQRLRQKRGTAPRSAPKFEFDAISSNAPKVPPEAWSQPAISQPIRPSMSDQDTFDPNTFEMEPNKSLWDTFYFRSLPLLVTVIACLGLILVAQRVAAKRQIQQMQSMPAVATSSDAPTSPTAQVPTAVPTPPTAPIITPSTLAPPVQPEPDNSSEAGSVTSEPTAPAPVITPKPETPKPKPAAKPKPTAKPKPQSRPTPRPQVPSEMPVLPPPRLTLPKRPAPSPSQQSDDDGAANTVGSGGPVDVGNAEDSNYIPINPPHFPNASRN